METYTQIKKSFPKIEKLFDDKTLEEFLDTNNNDLHLYHFSLGLWIRNNLLTANSALYQSFCQDGIYHKDDMSMIIIKIFHFYEQLKHHKLPKQQILPNNTS